MNESVLLRLCLVIAFVGVTSLFFVAEIPPTSITGELIWTNSTRGLVIYEESVWIQTQYPIILDTPQCVRVLGVMSQEQITNALLASSTDC
jgi:hypothetical protein